MDRKRGSRGDGCEIIAEAGINHNGEITLAKQLVDEAADAGADTVKFQTFVPEEVVSKDAEKADYQKRSNSEDQYEMLDRTVLSEAEHRELVGYCAERGIDFLSTPYDPESVSLLESLGLNRYKIASADIVNKPLLEAIADTGKPVILSTGMASLGEVERAVSFLESEGCPDLTILYCVSCYPADPEQVNMRFMDTLRTAFEKPVGFSDHTLGTNVGVVAAARGATIVEKHFTLDRSMDGPDHTASLEPEEMASFVDGIRTAEAALGRTKRNISDEEEDNIDQMRRSIHLRRSLDSGTEIAADDLKVVRPFEGIDPWHVEDVVGRQLDTGVEANEPLTWDHLE